ncbi:PIN domain-containing protein [Hydrogenophaga sp. PAMC20947]|uniref:PIN domain-containing protein n=1 Tax=Hydrogenophaga sp. PAMC20947 TaxID=2565558 RepID=UPI00109DE73D|nr:PIN domain-containing protein [Hydrogenophaga sp. PAMC20947]QCB47677.1 twitching motility protein PilT [Hydrogenophaga sp. PAMC20947]
MAPPIHYLLDTNAVLHSPEVLASARRLKLLIPKAVIGELTSRGREHIRNVVSSLINDALNAGAEVVNAPARLKDEPIASDRNAQRLSSADMDLARTAIGLSERDIPVCVVTLDKPMSMFLQSRSIRAITPSDFLNEQQEKATDPALLLSAQSFSSIQVRYMALSALVGGVGALGANAAYSNAAYLLSTAPVWGTVVALPLLGVLLFWYRQRFRLSYGIFEFAVGVMMSLYVFLPTFDYKSLNVLHGLQVLAGLYVMVRGLDNAGNGLQGTKMESIWKRVFGGG